MLLQKKEIERSLSDLENYRRVASKESRKETTCNEKLDHESLYWASQNKSTHKKLGEAQSHNESLPLASQNETTRDKKLDSEPLQDKSLSKEQPFVFG